MKKLLLTLFGATMFATAALGISACGAADDDDLDVYAPDGAPALALLNAIAKNDDTFDFDVVDAETIQTYVAGAAPKADICILPVSAAAKLLGTGTVYQMLGTVTNGNLYFLAQDGTPALTEENLKSELVGKKIGVVQLNSVPGFTLQAVLADHEIPYQTIESAQAQGDAEKANLTAFAPANIMPDGGCDYYLCPEPAASSKIAATASSAKPFAMAGSLQDLYGEGGYPQAVAVAKKSVIESRKADVDKFIGYLEGSAAYLGTVSPATVIELLDDVRTDGLTPSFRAENLTAQVIANCSVRFTASAACKETVNTFLQKLIGVKSDSTAIPAEAFFYQG